MNRKEQIQIDQEALLQNQRFSIGHIKRFLEVWSADRQFRELAAQDAHAAAQSYNLETDPEVIRALWDETFAREQYTKQVPNHPVVQRYKDTFVEKLIWRNRVKSECAPILPRFNEWRERQMARCLMQLGDIVCEQLIHTPLCFELSHGCSVGCRFCGLSAPPFSGVFSYTPGNVGLWRDVLEVTGKFIGPAARWGACYFATEPMDNPDYEKFCTDFFLFFDMFPQTTTALPTKDPERTRRLLKLSRARGCKVDRFSILSLPILKKVFQAFTPEELVDVELIVQNPESTSLRAASGRFLERMVADPGLANAEIQRVHDKAINENPLVSMELPKTISCLSGFLINMVERTCKLVSPWSADQRWPLGYIVYNQGTFTNGETLNALLHRMMEESMPISVSHLPRLRFRRGLTFTPLAEGFKVTDKYRQLDMKHSTQAGYYRDIGQFLKDGQHSAAQISLLCLYKHGVPDSTTLNILDSYFKNGILDEEPALPNTND